MILCSDEVPGDSLAPFGLSQLGGESVVLKNEGGMIVEMDGKIMDGSLRYRLRDVKEVMSQ